MSKVKALRAKTNRVLQRLNTENKTVRAIRGAVNTRIRNPLLRANARVNDAIDDNVLKVTTMLLDKKLISPKQASRIYDAIQSNESKYPAKSISDSIARDTARQRTLRTLGGTIPNTNTTQRLKNTITNRIANLPEPQNPTFRAKLDNINQKTKTINRLERKLAQNYRTARTAAKITPLGALIATMVASRNSDTPSKNADVKKRALPFHSSPPSLPNTRHPVSRSGKYMTKRAIQKSSTWTDAFGGWGYNPDDRKKPESRSLPWKSTANPSAYAASQTAFKNTTSRTMNPSAYAASQTALKDTVKPPVQSIFVRPKKNPFDSLDYGLNVYGKTMGKVDALKDAEQAVRDFMDTTRMMADEYRASQGMNNMSDPYASNDFVNDQFGGYNSYSSYDPYADYDSSSLYDSSSNYDPYADYGSSSSYDPYAGYDIYYPEPEPFVPEHKLLYGKNRISQNTNKSLSAKYAPSPKTKSHKTR